jgi:hypothetical protein
MANQSHTMGFECGETRPIPLAFVDPLLAIAMNFGHTILLTERHQGACNILPPVNAQEFEHDADVSQAGLKVDQGASPKVLLDWCILV